MSKTPKNFITRSVRYITSSYCAHQTSAVPLLEQFTICSVNFLIHYVFSHLATYAATSGRYFSWLPKARRCLSAFNIIVSEALVAFSFVMQREFLIALVSMFAAAQCLVLGPVLLVVVALVSLSLRDLQQFGKEYVTDCKLAVAFEGCREGELF